MKKFEERHLMEEGWRSFANYAMPLAGAGALGYMGYHAGDDVAEGLKQVSNQNQELAGQLKNGLDALSGKEYASTHDEVQKFLTPGEDGSWRKVGEALGHEKLGFDKYIPDEDMKRVTGTYRGGGAGLGALGGAAIGGLLAPGSKRK
jgi:hypothetical protein